MRTSQSRISLRAVCALVAIPPVVLAASALAQVSQETDYGLPYDYAQTAWPATHRDPRNSDFAPFVAPADNQAAWQALDGAATLLAPAIGPEGNLYVTTGQGPGTSHLHAFDRDGSLLWESAPQSSFDDLDSGAVASSPLVDRVGDVYVGDANQLWAFHSDGAVKWLTDLVALGGTGTLVTAVLTADGLVGGITSGGQVMFFDRQDGSLAVPMLDLPGGNGPPSEVAPPGLWEGGLLDPLAVQPLWDGLFGRACEVCNTPAVHPETGRIFVTAAAASETEGVLYGIDLVSGLWEIAFQTAMGGGSGTSPAIAPDGSQVYAVDGNGVMTAFDASDGAVLWTAPGTDAAASPAVGPDGTVYSGNSAPGAAHTLVALDSADGSVKWQANYDSLASALLPGLQPVPLLFPTGQPIVRTNSVVSVSAAKVWVALTLGYEFLNPLSETAAVQPRITLLAAIDPADGSVMDTTVLRDTNEGLVAIGSDGTLISSHAALLSSVFYYGVNPLLGGLPPGYRVSGPPLAGISVVEPASFLDHVEEGLSWVMSLDAMALDELPGGDAEAAFVAVRRGRAQLEATAGSIDDAEAAGEITATQAASAGASTESAEGYLTVAVGLLHTKEPSPEDQADAIAAISLAEAEIDAALEILTAPATPTPAPVGGVVELPAGFGEDSNRAESISSSFPATSVVVTLAAGCFVVLTVGAALLFRGRGRREG